MPVKYIVFAIIMASCSTNGVDSTQNDESCGDGISAIDPLAHEASWSGTFAYTTVTLWADECWYIGYYDDGWAVYDILSATVDHGVMNGTFDERLITATFYDPYTVYVEASGVGGGTLYRE